MMSNYLILLLFTIIGATSADEFEFSNAVGQIELSNGRRSSRSGFGKNGFIPLPWIPTRSPPACTAETLTTSCQCGSAICGPGQYCTNNPTLSVCNIPSPCTQAVQTELPCYCGAVKICNTSQVCVGTECTTPLACPGGTTTTTTPCRCGTEGRICTDGQLCTAATSTCDGPELSDCRSPFHMNNKPCRCFGPTDPTIVRICRAGQKCMLSGNSPLCTPAGDCIGTATNCLCGIEACIPEQTCRGQTCDPPICLGTALEIERRCVCVGVTENQICDVDTRQRCIPTNGPTMKCDP